MIVIVRKVRDLHESLVATGLSQLGVVIDADGFLPDGLVSPFYLLSRL